MAVIYKTDPWKRIIDRQNKKNTSANICNCETDLPNPEYHDHGCHVRKDLKLPRLFYYEDALSSYIPAPDNVGLCLSLSDMSEGEDEEVIFRRFDMTDEDFDKLSFAE